MRHGRLVPAALGLLALAAALWWASGADRRAQRDYQHALDSTLAEPGRALQGHARIGDPAIVAEVRAIYRRRHTHALWVRARGPDQRLDALRSAMELIRVHGLDPSPYGVMATLDTIEARQESGRWRQAAPRTLAALEVRLTAGLAACGRDVLWGRLPPRALDRDWWQGRDTLDVASRLEHAASHRAIARELAAWMPHEPAYTALRRELVRLRAVDHAGGWTRIGTGPELRLGMRDRRVALLRDRMIESGDLVDEEPEANRIRASRAGPRDEALAAGVPAGRVPPADRLFDRPLVQALRRAQRRHGLEPSGRLDAVTRAALDRPVAERIRQIELNLERWRWLPRTRGEPRIEVNIPDFTFAMWDSGRAVLRMRVVVGSKTHPTPVFSDSLAYLEMNPTWRLPKRILVEEVIPEIQKDTTYLALNHMRILFTKGRTPVEVPAAGMDWTGAEADSFPYLVVQDAGTDNPLGRIKFMCPNEYDVYLHDTPSQGLFRAGARDRSHGCVRLERPLDLAERLLHGHPSGSRDSIDAILAAGLWRRLRLARHVPLDVLYWTAWVDSAGALQFRDDLYGLDGRLDEALRTGRTRGFEINPEVLWGEKKLAADAALDAATSAPSRRASSRPP